jgi:predicted glycogen debranching enzyme
MTGVDTAVRPVRRLVFDEGPADPALEWLVTNGLGGYASGPIRGGLSRRYHGVLIASLPAPLGRTLYVPHARVTLCTAAGDVLIDHEDARALDGPNVARLREFRLEAGLPIWTYAAGGLTVEKRVVMPHRQNTTWISFVVSGADDAVRLRIAPFISVRPHEGSVSTARHDPPHVTQSHGRVEIAFADPDPTLRCRIEGGAIAGALDAPETSTVEYAVEHHRGYDHTGPLWTPGALDIEPEAGAVSIAFSTESWAHLDHAASAEVLATELARREALLVRADPADAMEAELALAAEQFLITPVGRSHEVAEMRAEGEEPRTIIAGYHWFTDWGRDTMISLEGLTLETGRGADARHILHMFARHVQDGLIPNLFPEGEHQGLYHTADATLWFFHAIARYAARTGDTAMIRDELDTIVDILDHHMAGTRFGIHVDPADGLLVQGAEHYQLTGMDAKVGVWVVTPRRGKAVEINALWYNALRLAADWLDEAGRETAAERYRAEAGRVRLAFNRRFWNDASACLYDVVDGEQGDDAAIRPNQVLAIALPHPVLDPARWDAVLSVVLAELLTPVGLRSLAPGDPHIQPRYFGDLHARDAAYHQGTVWAWLMGPLIDAYLKVHPGDVSRARALLEGFVPPLNRACVGSISEIFDAEAPFTPRGCIAQAWSVAEVLRVWKGTRVRAD